jgi:hypothetical protein
VNYTHTHKEIQEVVLSSTKSARYSGDHLPRDTRPGLSSTHFVSDRRLLGIGVLGHHAVREVQRGVRQRMEKMATEFRQKWLDPPRVQRRNSLFDIDT